MRKHPVCCLGGLETNDAAVLAHVFALTNCHPSCMQSSMHSVPQSFTTGCPATPRLRLQLHKPLNTQCSSELRAQPARACSLCHQLPHTERLLG